eukprot:g29920.t1
MTSPLLPLFMTVAVPSHFKFAVCFSAAGIMSPSDFIPFRLGSDISVNPTTLNIYITTGGALVAVVEIIECIQTNRKFRCGLFTRRQDLEKFPGRNSNSLKERNFWKMVFGESVGLASTSALILEFDSRLSCQLTYANDSALQALAQVLESDAVRSSFKLSDFCALCSDQKLRDATREVLSTQKPQSVSVQLKAPATTLEGNVLVEVVNGVLRVFFAPRSALDLVQEGWLLDQVEHSVIVTTLDGTIKYWNDFASKMFQYERPEALGQNVSDILTTKQSREQALEIMKQLGDGKSWQGEFLVRRKDKSWFKAHVSDVPVRNAAGQLIGIVGMSWDITDVVRPLELRQAVEERSKLRLKHFFRCVCHELRVPLNSISVGVSCLRMEVQDAGLEPGSSSLLSVVDGLEGCVDNVITIVNDMLDLGKLEEGRFSINLSRVKVAPLLRRELSQFKQLASSQNTRLTCDIQHGDHIELVTDATRLCQVVRVFLSNALKELQDTGGVVVLSSKLQGQQLRIEVMDDGKGCDQRTLDHLFTAYFQASKTEPYKDVDTKLKSELARANAGTGLGLSIAKRLTEMLGGQTGAGSKGPGHGCTFYLTLPLNRITTNKPNTTKLERELPALVESSDNSPVDSDDGCPATPQLVQHDFQLPNKGPTCRSHSFPQNTSPLSVSSVEHSTLSSHSTLLPPRKRRKHSHKADREHDVATTTAARAGCSECQGSHRNRILFVEDDAVCRKLTHRILQKSFDVDMATNGQEAVDMFSSSRHHLVLMDRVMPLMDGLVAASKIRQIAPHVPILGLTGLCLGDEIQEFLSAGATKVMGKPVPGMQLLPICSQLIQSAQTNRQSKQSAQPTTDKCMCSCHSLLTS